MQFIDQAIIDVRAGSGGDGISAFRREKYVPAGGPAGGDGGQGGNVIFEADDNLQTLLDFKFQKLISAENGHRGGPNKCTGASGKDTVLRVPCGTEVRHLSTNIIFGDLTHKGQQLIVAFGGKGGFGNARYLSNSNRAPEKFTEGKLGEEWSLRLELKLLAEVGIIGLPNAGKSTLISVLSSARPKIADYPFTTLIPNLGVVRRPSGDGTVFADIPGLISGASKGIGLGHDFLRHIERTKVLLHLIDSASIDPINDFKTINEELTSYGHGLISRPRIFALNKKELLNEYEMKKLLHKIEKLTKKKVHIISAVMKFGLDDLLSSIWNELGY